MDLESLFSRAGTIAMDEVLRKPALFAFDFDGTIAPIVDNPKDAVTLKVLRPPLCKLASKAHVAIVSGRGLKDVKSRLYFRCDFVVGNHGLEGLSKFRAKGEKAKRICRKWTAQLSQRLADLHPKSGIFVEDKCHSLTLHYRHAKNPSQAVRWLESEIDNLWPLPRVVGGKDVFNLLPKGSPHKGSALKALMKHFACPHAVFVGDDLTDEDAFREKGKILSVLVGRRKDSLAKFFIRDQDEMLKMLNEFLRRIL